MRRSVIFTTLPRAVLVVLLAGCGVFGPKLVMPNLDIVGIEMLESDFFQQKLRVRLNVQNPNARELPVKGVSCDIEVNGERFARGVSAAEFVVPAMGEAQFDMIVNANMAGMLVRLLGRKDSAAKSLDYRMTGKVNLASGLLRSIPFSESGTLPLP